MQEVIFFFDDSGVLHKNAPGDYFVYAGYVFTSQKELDNARRKYININKKIRETLNRNDELKAANIEAKHKRALFKAVEEYDSIAGVVQISRIYDNILANKKSICRIKDYVIKRCVKKKLEQLLFDGVINKDDDIKIKIYIDEQQTASNGYYSLRDSIIEELKYGIANFDYGVTHPKLFYGSVDVLIQYCDSSKNYMIQASDILANRIWSSYIKNDKKMRIIDNHIVLTFP